MDNIHDEIMEFYKAIILKHKLSKNDAIAHLMTAFTFSMVNLFDHDAEIYKQALKHMLNQADKYVK